MAQMKWDKLLCKKRARKSKSAEEIYRNEFDKDYERVVNSSSLRRLQDKAQVFPLQENDFTRTRLTHSIEVSSIARSMGKQIGYILFNSDNKKSLVLKAEELSSLLAVCGLVHDLGNPPFGHYGEDVIKDWFRNLISNIENMDDNENKYKELFEKNDIEWLQEYALFDGNAQTLRILSKLQYLKDTNGINFTYGTLATLIKYPNKIGKNSNDSKICCFTSEKKLFEKIIRNTGMKTKSSADIKRHPATYILEAADDISYLFADLEDAVKKGYLPWEEVKGMIFAVTNDDENFKDLKKEISKAKRRNKKNCVPPEECDYNEVVHMKLFCQGKCIKYACEEFVNNIDEILNGDYNSSLCDCKKLRELVGEKNKNGDKGIIRKICFNYAYGNKEVLELELIGKTVITSLLDRFIFALLDDNKYMKTNTESGKLFNIISSNYRHIQNINTDGVFCKDKYLSKQERVQLVIDYISGMTDSYALNLHKTLLGTKLP